jgi:DNA-binding MarR family transcriptional regulator
MDLRDLARANRRQILKCILQTGGISCSEIARRTGLANSSVTDIIYALIEKRMLCTQEVRRNGMRGRPSIVLSLDPEQSLVVVADYSDQQAVAHLADPDQSILEH